MDVIIPTWEQINNFAILAIIMLGFLVYAWFKGKKEEDRTMTWIRDWDERR